MPARSCWWEISPPFVAQRKSCCDALRGANCCFTACLVQTSDGPDEKIVEYYDNDNLQLREDSEYRVPVASNRDRELLRNYTVALYYEY